MPKRNLLRNSAFSGDTVIEDTIPTGVDAIQGTLTLSAPISNLNVHDISCHIYIYEDDADGVPGWRLRDSSYIQRDPINGPLTPIEYGMHVRLERIAGKPIRVTLSSGPCVLNADLNIEW